MISGFPAAVEQIPFFCKETKQYFFNPLQGSTSDPGPDLNCKQVIDGLKIWFTGYCKEYFQAHGARSSRLVKLLTCSKIKT